MASPPPKKTPIEALADFASLPDVQEALTKIEKMMAQMSQVHQLQASGAPLEDSVAVIEEMLLALQSEMAAGEAEQNAKAGG